MSMLRFADQSRSATLVRLAGGVPILAMGLSHIFAEGAETRPIVEALGLPLAVAAETAAGVLLILGFWARLGAAIAVAVMAVAIYAHVAIDVWPGPPLIVLACAAYVLWRGAGRWSLDARAASR